MKYIYLFVLSMINLAGFSQTRKVAVIGSSTSAGLAASSPDSGWVRRFSNYYKNQLGAVDTVYNLAVSGTTVYKGMPTSYSPPGGYPTPDPASNITRAHALLSDLPVAANGVVIVNYPTNGYDNYTVPEVLARLQTIYDSAVRTGNRCYVTTTQPRQDGNFATSALKRKLAVLKDSIINRFGIANTLNFWDGMFNPADTTILTAYSAGDNVHFNNAGHRELFNRVVAKNIFALSATAVTGDYRSNVSPTGLWGDASSWQTFNGTTWVAASAAPTSSSGVITIVTGDSIRLSTAFTVDQVVVESGAILTLFNTGTPTTFTLNDGPGVDITVNGKLYVSAGATLVGGGTIQNNAGGTFIVRNQGVLSVPATNDGNTTISGTGNIANTSFINNGTFTLADFTLNLNNATLSNYGTMNFPFSGNSFVASAATGTLINNAAGIMNVANRSAVVQAVSAIGFTNSGRLTGKGQFIFSNTVVNTGTISPTDSLVINPTAVTNKTPSFLMELNSAGAVAGTNYDQVLFAAPGATTVNISGSTLRVTDRAADAIGTTYTLFTFPAGTITGAFAGMQIPNTLALSYGSNAITLVRTGLLPLTWVSFTAVPNGQQVNLHWSTAEEVNVSHFVVEHSVDGVTYTAIGNVSGYHFVHTAPSAGNNFYRIKQVDNDGQFSYSMIRTVKFGNARVVHVSPNPVQDVLRVNVISNVSIGIYDVAGKLIRKQFMAPGTHYLQMGSFKAGIYHIVVYKNQHAAETYDIIKL